MEFLARREGNSLAIIMKDGDVRQWAQVFNYHQGLFPKFFNKKGSRIIPRFVDDFELVSWETKSPGHPEACRRYRLNKDYSITRDNVWCRPYSR